MQDPWAEPLTKRNVPVVQSTSSSDSDLDSNEQCRKEDETCSTETNTVTRKKAGAILPNPEQLLGTDSKRPKFLDPEALRDAHSYGKPKTSTKKDIEEPHVTEKEFDIARMAPPLKGSKEQDSNRVIKSKALVYDKRSDDAPRIDRDKKAPVKEKEKLKRIKGQSTHSSWKSEGEMLLRQQYD
ncbi:hypothetical protein PSENEW3n2_00005046 [Picochlorum sp. SENEW3]|nr:hypothetical protein PSENEW3n2_00005046 [Picochlorum sp. SENEW3]WPT17039.1 hypothetical protein PSENEW3_00005046 [Picochlorum sp. SENEW3]